MRRREFLGTLCCATVTWPQTVRAQERMRRIGVMMNQSPSDPENMARATAFLEALRQRGWIDRQNIQIDLRWDAGTIDNARKIASELVALSPDVILASGVTSLMALRGHPTIPQVFSIAPDPVGAGFVESLARPGGNITGFMQFEYSL